MSSSILSIKVKHLAGVLQSYDSIQIGRSTTGIGGPYTLLTPNILLNTYQRIYTYVDTSAAPGYFYQTNYYNSVTGSTSPFSEPFAGAVIDPSFVSVAEMTLINGSGHAVPGQHITFHFIGPPETVGGFDLAFIKEPVETETDLNGQIKVPLIKSTQWKVVFEGTRFIREIEIPTTTPFDLLTVMGLAPDTFSISELEFPAAPRRSL